MGNPRRTLKVNIAARILPQTLEEFRKIARDNGITTSHLLSRVIDDYLGRKENINIYKMEVKQEWEELKKKIDALFSASQ